MPAPHPEHLLSAGMAVPVSAGRDPVVAGALTTLGDRAVAAFSVSGGHYHGALGEAGADAATRVVRLAADVGVPVLGFLDTSGADVHEGVSSLDAWGRLARALVDASGVVPIVFVLTGPCLSGPALLLGLADFVVMTREAFAYVSGPGAVADFTGEVVGRRRLGGATVHARRSGLAAFLADNDAAALDAAAALLGHLPGHYLDDPPRVSFDDPPDRMCGKAAAAVPVRPSATYDVRAVLDDVLDAGSFLEVWPAHASNLVTGFGYLGGRSVGVVANQPGARAGTLDIDASRKGARFVQSCDAFNIPLLTFVDTPGFEPGRDLEWRGIIRHGAELVHAYSTATVPRLCVVLRKAYGGAYIVMDSKRLASDLCLAWPTAEIAVMGSRGAVQILSGRQLIDGDAPGAAAARRAALEADYDAQFANPYRAAERGFVDAVIEPGETRRALVQALDRFATKRGGRPVRRHSNTPL